MVGFLKLNDFALMLLKSLIDWLEFRGKKVLVSHLTFIEKIYPFSTCHMCLCGTKEWHLIGD